LIAFNDSYIPIALYIILTSIISLIAIWTVKDRYNEDLDQQDTVAIEKFRKEV